MDTSARHATATGRHHRRATMAPCRFCGFVYSADGSPVPCRWGGACDNLQKACWRDSGTFWDVHGARFVCAKDVRDAFTGRVLMGCDALGSWRQWPDGVAFDVLAVFIPGDLDVADISEWHDKLRAGHPGVPVYMCFHFAYDRSARYTGSLGHFAFLAGVSKAHVPPVLVDTCSFYNIPFDMYVLRDNDDEYQTFSTSATPGPKGAEADD